MVFPQDPFTYNNYLYSLVGEAGEEQENVLLGIINNNNVGQNQNEHANWDSCSHSSSPEVCTVDQTLSSTVEATVGRRKRRRTKNTKNKEEIENQRMTHITVERNRRKQMNHYLNVLRSLMPSSYVQRVSFNHHC